MRDDERFQLREDGGVPAECELGVDSLLEGAQPLLVETGDLGLSEVVVREVGQGLPAPELERLPDRGLCAARISAGELSARVVEQISEPVAVELALLDDQEIAVATCLQALRLSERSAHTRNLCLEALDGGGRSTVRPERVDEAIDRDDLIRVKQQEGDEDALLAAAEGDCAVVAAHLEWAEQPEF